MPQDFTLAKKIAEEIADSGVMSEDELRLLASYREPHAIYKTLMDHIARAVSAADEAKIKSATGLSASSAVGAKLIELAHARYKRPRG